MSTASAPAAALADCCPFCGRREAARQFEAADLQFGSGGSFPYAVCASCGSLYLIDRAIDLGAHYPEGYYAYASAQRSFVQRCAERFANDRRARFVLRLLCDAGVRLDPGGRIVDVGSGAGELLAAFGRKGYAHLLGSDPFLRAGAATNGVAVDRRTIAELAADERLAGSASLVMFHHSLEHIFDPQTALAAAAALLRPSGGILVRIPIVSAAWERYGTHWVGLDAPRHVAVPTERGMRDLAARSGLRVALARYDSTEMQFVASEAYARGLTLNQAFPAAPLRTLARKVLTIPQMLHAARLNARGRGDQAAFVLLPERIRTP
jgi:SAM-dependent methyltransferase